MSTEKITIESIAPVRVDLAGGTVDIWPLYLLLNQPKTINFGISLFAKTTLEAAPSSKPQVILKSVDQKKSHTFTWSEILDESMQAIPELILPVRLLRYFAQLHTNPRALEFSLTTEAKSPAGAGLGGSSALSISIIGALWKWTNPRTPLDLEKDGEFLISLTRDVESQVLYGPAGLQDYYGAAFGGLQVLNWKIARNERTSLPSSLLKELEARTLLFYSGKSRNSGINNWGLFKGLIDKDAEVDRKFRAICEATGKVEAALLKQDFKAVVASVRDEWEVRKTLAPGISTPEMDEAYARARAVSDIAFKVCGAGGGGCFFILLPEKDPQLKMNVLQAVLRSSEIQPLSFEAVPHGLTVKVGT
jgi:D-glycero-alpha-D-manno-heptose-7-phosphate kinase